MRRYSMIVSLFVALVPTLVCPVKAAAMYDPRTGRFISRDVIAPGRDMAMASDSQLNGVPIYREGITVKDGFGNTVGNYARETPNRIGRSIVRDRGDNTYVDGPNLYQYDISSPLIYTDPMGQNIYIITGNNGSSSSFLNNALHQKICADVWTLETGKDGVRTFIWDGLLCYSFGLSGPGIIGFHRTWLGFRSQVFPSCAIGQIYVDDYTGGRIDKVRSTTPLQDTHWLVYMDMDKRKGTADVYSLARHNCRMYVDLEFADAPNHW